MPYIGQPLNAGNLSVQTGTGDGSDTTPIAALNYSVGSSESVAIYLDGVKQAVSTYVASGTVLTFTTAPPNGVGIEVVFLALAISLPTPGDSTVTNAKIVSMDGSKLTGTVTGNTTITALADAAVVLTAAELYGGMFTITPTVARILTTDTAANIIAAIPNGIDTSSFEFVIVNKAGFDVTFAGGTGVTIHGKTIVANGSATFRVVRVSPTTVGLYRSEGGLNWSAARRTHNGMAVANATETTIVYDTLVYDKLGELDATGRFTAKSAGIYNASATLRSAGEAWVAGEYFRVGINKNGSGYAFGWYGETDASITKLKDGVATTDVSLAVGDYLEVSLLQNSGASINLIAADSHNWFSVHRVA